MSYILFATLLFAAISGILSFYRHARKLQRNAYSLLGYIKWLKDSYTTEFAVNSLLYCAIILGIRKEKEILALVLAAVLLVLRLVMNVNIIKKSKNRLVFTVRVKAFYITAIVILGASIIITKLSTDIMLANVFCTLGLLLSIIMPALTFVVWLITYPLAKISSTKPKKESAADDETVD